MADAKPHMNLAVIGHVDHGKSTLVGRLMFEAGAISPHIIEQYKKEALRKANIKTTYWRGEPLKNGLFYQFKKWLEFVKTHYPWLRFMSTKKAYHEMQIFDKTRLGCITHEEQVLIEINIVPSFFVLCFRDNTKIKKNIGCELLHEWRNDCSTQYVFKAINNKIEITISPGSTSEDKNNGEENN